MSRRGKKKGRPISGWVILDKPVGMGSTEAVSKIKWLFQADKAGHAGTLDPLASGMLPIALGEATKTVPYVQDGAKVYRFTVAWGEERSTDDLEGPVTKSSDKPASRGGHPRAAAEIYRRHHADAAAVLGDQDRRRTRLRSRPRRRDWSKSRPVRSRSAVSTCWRPRRRAIPCSRSNAARAPMCVRWRAISAAISAATATSPALRRTEVDPFTAEDLVPLAELEAAAPKREEAPSEGIPFVASERTLRRARRIRRRHRRCARLPAAVHHHRRRGGKAPARQSDHPARPRCARRGRRGLRDGARQAGGHRRHRSRHVQAEAGFRRLRGRLRLSWR